MALREVEGDILLSKAQAIAHGVAPADHFNQGLAMALRAQYPAMAKDFRHYCQVDHPKAGGIWAWAGADGRRIINLLTQEPAPDHRAHPGKATLHNVRHSLRELAKFAESESLQSLALPRLATGVGGLDWEAVRELIDAELGELDIPIDLYVTYRSGVAA